MITLTRLLGDIGLAEVFVQNACAVAVQKQTQGLAEDLGQNTLTVASRSRHRGPTEDLGQNTFTVTAQKQTQEPPPNPGVWIVTTARNRAIDRLRRESTRRTPARPATPRRCCCTNPTNPSRWDRCATTSSA
ncbi:sigma factor [Nonomuraea sp. NPDC048892]|uniref:sigma factor n=1 Tax=Nonomuraea sp. NPDC048892 TaxID=3154624 RepID=UPI00340AB1D7